MLIHALPGSFQRCTPSSDGLAREFDRMVGTFFNPQHFPASPTVAPREAARTGVPPINVSENEHAFFVEAELPGYKLSDLDMHLLANELTISGSRESADSAAPSAKILRQERPSGRFLRTLRLGTDIDAAKVEATLTAGVLTIRLPKAEAAKPRKIAISVN